MSFVFGATDSVTEDFYSWAEATLDFSAPGYTGPNAAVNVVLLGIEPEVADSEFVEAVINGAAGTTRDLAYKTGGLNRWIIRANATAESGANAGSNLDINRYDDSGASLGTALRIIRSTGVFDFLGGSLNNVGLLEVQSDNPFITVVEDDASTDEKQWRMGAVSGTFYLRLYSDASAAVDCIEIHRTGNVLDDVEIFGPLVVQGVTSSLPSFFERIYAFETNGYWDLQVAPDEVKGGNAAGSGGTLAITYTINDPSLATLTVVMRGIQDTTGYICKIELRAEYYRNGGGAIYFENSAQIVRKQLWDPSDGTEQDASDIAVAVDATGNNARIQITNDTANDIDFSLGCPGGKFAQSLALV